VLRNPKEEAKEDGCTFWMAQLLHDCHLLLKVGELIRGESTSTEKQHRIKSDLRE